MAGGGSGGGGTTTTHAEIAPELRPLFTGVGQQILQTQGALPLSQFAQWNPEQVAGIAPLQQLALDHIPSMTQAPPGLQALFDSSRGVNAAATSLYGVGGQNHAQQAALNALSASGRIGPMSLASSAMPTDQFAAQLPDAPQATLFPGAPPPPAGVAAGGPSLMTPQAPPSLAGLQHLMQQIQGAPSPYYNG